MRKMNKKGFTIVELVIVIAVIAILSAVLIPTFSGVVGNAEVQAAYSDAKAAYTEYFAANAEKGTVEDDFIYAYNTEKDMYVVIKDGQVVKTIYENETDALDALNDAFTAAEIEAAKGENFDGTTQQVVAGKDATVTTGNTKLTAVKAVVESIS